VTLKENTFSGCKLLDRLDFPQTASVAMLIPEDKETEINTTIIAILHEIAGVKENKSSALTQEIEALEKKIRTLESKLERYIESGTKTDEQIKSVREELSDRRQELADLMMKLEQLEEQMD
jgi:chromosome segregation ATPase